MFPECICTCISTVSKVFEGKKVYIQKEGKKVAVKTLSMLVKEEGHSACMIQSTSCIHMDHTAEKKSPKSRQGGSFTCWFLSQQGGPEAHSENLSSVSGKSKVSQEAEPQRHTWRRSSQGGHQNQVWSIAACMLLLHSGMWHLDYLGFRALGCPTESTALSSKHRHQSYYLPALDSLQVCSDAGVQPVKREAHLIHSGAQEISETNFNLCCRSIQPV